MTNIVVLIKQVPDYADRRPSVVISPSTARVPTPFWTRSTKAVEEALQIKEREEAAGGSSTVTVLTAGPEKAGEAIRKALSMGADKGVLPCSTSACTARTWSRPVGPWPARWVRSRASNWSSPATRPAAPGLIKH